MAQSTTAAQICDQATELLFMWSSQFHWNETGRHITYSFYQTISGTSNSL